MKKREEFIMKRLSITILLLSLILFPFTAFAQTEGIPLQMDVFLGSPIYGPEVKNPITI